MTMRLAFLLALMLAVNPAPALAAAGNFSIVNKTGAAISALSIRRAGTASWRPLPAAPASGARSAIAFSDPDCAFDLQARTADGQTLIYPGVNLCDVGTVTLNRAGANLWIDYD